MEQLVDQVVQAVRKAGLVEVEVSARHVHLSQEDMETLFGSGATLHPKRPLSQPGQFLSEERANLIGNRGRKEHVAILGPVRSHTQIELSKSDCVDLKIDAPLRESGHLDGAASIRIEGPKGVITVKQGAIVAHNHIHVPPKMADELCLKNGEHVSVKVLGRRPMTFNDVIIRISENFRFRMHIDFDEANAAFVSGFTLGKIIKKEKD